MLAILSFSRVVFSMHPSESLSFLRQNYLQHRCFIFDDRVEIHSPGILPNRLTVDDIVVGTSMPRNMLLFTNTIYLLPYTGAGSGMLRALSEDVNVSFINNDRTNFEKKPAKCHKNTE